MSHLILSLVVVPWIVSILLLISKKEWTRLLTGGAVGVLSILSFVLLFQVDTPVSFSVPSGFDMGMVVADVALLVYFAYLGIRHKSWLVGGLAGLQMGLLVGLLQSMPTAHAPQFYVDKLSIFMYLLINVVSGIICLYALRYIEDEDVSDTRRRRFMATLMWFVGVMNFIVSVDNLEWFFLLFELTTLASFILISFRQDSFSIRNALRALWMNQIGGVAILAGLIMLSRVEGYQSLSLSHVVSQAHTVGIVLPFALIAVAALIKGAQMPFSSWLVGAMVAPTPVSALLHSSTMVKLAPFIMLRLSPALKGTPVAYVIMLSCAFGFVVASLGALAKDNFKLILAQSTIALLSLMILLAAQGSETAVMAALFLILFHGISKCLLFLDAGILEKVFHIKSTTQIHEIAEIGPTTAFFAGFGFLSLMLPPFGAFLGKWLGVEVLAAASKEARVGNVFILVAIAVGSAILSLLYLKVIGGLVMRSGAAERVRAESMSPLYKYSAFALVGLLIAGMAGILPLVTYYLVPTTQTIVGSISDFRVEGFELVFGQSRLALWPMFGAIVLLPIIVIAANFVRFKGVDRVREYNCGERFSPSFSAYYFSFDRFHPYFVAVGALFFASVILAGRLPL